jgi:hypothetical protein
MSNEMEQINLKIQHISCSIQDLAKEVGKIKGMVRSYNNSIIQSDEDYKHEKSTRAVLDVLKRAQQRSQNK